MVSSLTTSIGDRSGALGASVPDRFAAHRSLKALAVQGSMWTLGAFSTQQVLRLGSNLILTRLLVPEAFGLMALVVTLTRGLRMLSEVGVQPAIIRDQRGDDAGFLNTAWTIEVVRGAILWLTACALAWPFAKMYGQPMLAAIIPVAAFSVFIRGFKATGMYTARRHMQLGRLNLVELTANTSALIAMIIWACFHRSVLALAAGGLIGPVVLLVLSYTCMDSPRHRFCWDKDAARRLFGFGKWIFLSTVVLFISQQADRLLLGGLVSMSMLGVYSIAAALAQLPIELNNRLVRQVGYPVLSRKHRERGSDIREAYYRVRRPLDAMFLPGIGLAAGASSIVIELMYDPRYLEAGWMLKALCVRAAMRCVLEPCRTCLVALGEPRYDFMQNAVRLAWLAVAFPAGWMLAGLPGIVVAVGLSELPVLAVLWYGMGRHRLLDLRWEFVAAIMFLTGLLGGTALEAYCWSII